MLSNLVLTSLEYNTLVAILIICGLGVLYILLYNVISNSNNNNEDGEGESEDEDIDLWPK